MRSRTRTRTRTRSRTWTRTTRTRTCRTRTCRIRIRSSSRCSSRCSSSSSSSSRCSSSSRRALWRRRGSALRRVRSVRGVAAGSCAGTRGRARRQGAAHRFLPPSRAPWFLLPGSAPCRPDGLPPLPSRALTFPAAPPPPPLLLRRRRGGVPAGCLEARAGACAGSQAGGAARPPGSTCCGQRRDLRRGAIFAPVQPHTRAGQGVNAPVRA